MAGRARQHARTGSRPRTNVPAAETVAPPHRRRPVTAGSQRVHDMRNLELDKTTTRTTRPAGGVARLSVAVLVDHAYEVKKEADGKETRTTKPRDPAFLQQVSDLTAKVVGLDTSRGDELTVQNVAFEQTLVEALPEEPQGLLQRVSPMWIARRRDQRAGRAGGHRRGAAQARAGAARRRRRPQQVSAQVLPQQQLPRTIEEIEGEIEAQLDASAASAFADRRVPVLTKRLQGILQKEPEAAARIVRTWIVEEHKKAKA